MALLINPDSLAFRSFGGCDGCEAHLIMLCNAQGMQVKLTDFGASVVSLLAPDRHGELADVVLGYDDVHGFRNGSSFQGCIVGRFANRIANAQFELDGHIHRLERNSGAHHLHSGSGGFGQKLWGLVSRDHQRAEFTVTAAGGEAGYPGTLQVNVVYRLDDDNTLRIFYSAKTDQATVVNLTNHAYFNLRGHEHASESGVLDHQLQLQASSFLPTDADGIPRGRPQEVADTPMDFRQLARIGSRIDQPFEQLLQAGGYDHCWVADVCPCDEPAFIAKLRDPVSGRQLTVCTTQPGVQVYTANGLRETVGKSGCLYGAHGAVCLETQHFPDSPNRPDFPATVLRPGQLYSHQASWQFSAS